MSLRKKTAIWIILACGILGTGLTVFMVHRWRPVTLKGVVLTQETDANKQLPISDVQITAVNSLGDGNSKSDSSGFFSLTLPKGLKRRQPVILRFRHEGYQALNLDDFVEDKIYI